MKLVIELLEKDIEKSKSPQQTIKSSGLLSAKVPPEVYGYLYAMAEEKGVTISYLVKQALLEFIKNEEGEK